MNNGFSLSDNVVEKDVHLHPNYRRYPGLDVPDWVVSEAHLINRGLDAGVVTLGEANEGLFDPTELRDVMRNLTELTFFVEFPPENVEPNQRGQALLEMFASPVNPSQGDMRSVAEYLRAAGHSVSISMSTLDHHTAEAVRYLNQHEVPVTAWVVLDDKDGYWTNPTNMYSTGLRTLSVIDWIEQNELDVRRLGFDIEKPINYIGAMARGDFKDVLKTQHRDYVQDARAAEGLDGPAGQHLERIIEAVKNKGYETEVYTMPRFSKKMLGGMDIDPSVPDEYVEMVYTTDLPVAAKYLAEKGRGARLLRNKHAVPAFGIVSGNGETPGRKLTDSTGTHLTEQQLAANMRAVLKQDNSVPDREFELDKIYVFALNDPRVLAMADAALTAAYNGIPVRQ